MYPDAGVFEFRLSFDGPKMTLDADPLDRQLHYLDGERGWLHPCTLVWPRQRLDTNMGWGTGWWAPRAEASVGTTRVGLPLAVARRCARLTNCFPALFSSLPPSAVQAR